MSFMYNPFPYDDPRAVNRPALPKKTVGAVVAGTSKAAAALAGEIASRLKAAPGKNVVVGFDGYATADWTRMVNLLSQQLLGKGIGVDVAAFTEVLKSEREIADMINPNLEWDTSKDPSLLFGRLIERGYEDLFDASKFAAFKQRLEVLRAPAAAGRVLLVYGSGCLVEEVRGLYDIKCYFDVTPKEAILRIRRGQFANLGDKVAAPANRVIRRCYYADFEMGVRHRGKLLRGKLLDYYMASDRPDHIHMIPMEALSDIFRSLACYPFRCKPVYLEGVWGGTYVKKLRNLPDTMRNCAWVFDLIPMEVSIVVEAGDEKIDFPYFSFVQKEGEAIMGRPCVEKFGGYFPIRFNYDDTFHSNGNMSIQVHSGAKYNQEHFGELGRQDESYYVVVAGQDAKTFVGFRDDADTEQFIRDIKLADTEYKPVDYLKYVSYEDSKPGLQVMLPAGTIHSSGRNQVVLEIGSLTIGSYTYKLYDYLRADLDGKPRPIHTWHGERAACKVTVTRKNEEAARKKPTLDTTSLSLVLQYNDLHPTHQLQLANSDHSFLYVYQWMSSNPEVATVSDKGLVTAQAAGTTTITAMVSNGQALRCSVTVTSDIGKVTLNKSDLLLRTVGTQERLTATVAVEGGGGVPITWVSSNPGVVTVDTDGVVTAIADGEAKVTALSPAGRFDVCSVVVGMAAEKYESEADLADELKLPDPYVAVRLNKLA